MEQNLMKLSDANYPVVGQINRSVLNVLLFLLPTATLLISKGLEVVAALMITVGFIAFLQLLIKGKPWVHWHRYDFWFIGLLALYPFLIVIYIWVYPDFTLTDLDKPSRLWMAIPIYYAIRALKPNFHFFFVGCVLAGILSGVDYLFSTDERYLGPRGIFIISYGQMLLTIWGLVLFYAIYHYQNLKKHHGLLALVFILSLVLCFLALLGSHVRGAWLAWFFIFPVILILIRRYRLRIMLGGVVALLISAVLAYHFSSDVQLRVNQVVAELEQMDIYDGRGSSSARLIMYREGFNLAREHLLFGVGNEGFTEHLTQLRSEHSTIQVHSSPHNAYLHFILFYGLVGFVLIASFYIYYGYLAYQISRTKRSTWATRWLGACSLMVLVVVMACGLTQSMYVHQNHTVFIILFLVITMGLTLNQYEKDRKTRAANHKLKGADTPAN